MTEEIPKLVQPREHKAKVIIWSGLNRLDDAVTPEQIKYELASIFELNDYENNLKTAVLIDFYYYNIQFCRDNAFTLEQTSSLFSILKKMHEICIETPFGNVQQCFNYFREAILCHAVKRPPFSIDLFNAQEVRTITDYVLNTYFRHYKMYKYVFTPLVRLDLSIKYEGIEDSIAPSESGELQDIQESVEAIPNNDDIPEEEVPKCESPKDEEPPAAQELRAMIKEHLTEELKKLKVNVEEKLKESDEVLNKKLIEVEGTMGQSGKKGSSKGRHK